MWMNEMEVDEAVNLLRHKPIYGPAAIFLQDFKDLINNISDGWAYWSYGTKCSNDLQAIVQEGVQLKRMWGPHTDTGPTYTKADVIKATKKIQRFLRNNKQTQGVKIPELNLAVEQNLYWTNT